MTQSTQSTEGNLIRLALAICQEDPILASAIIEEGIPLSGKKISFPLSDGSFSSPPQDVPPNWFSDGSSPLVWVVGRMLEIARGSGPRYSSMPNSWASGVFGLPANGSRPKNYGSEAESSLEALSQIGGALLAAGISPDVRMGRTARSQKAIEALKSYLPEYATAFQAAANRRMLQEVQRKANPGRKTVEQEPYRPKM